MAQDLEHKICGFFEAASLSEGDKIRALWAVDDLPRHIQRLFSDKLDFDPPQTAEDFWRALDDIVAFSNLPQVR